MGLLMQSLRQWKMRYLRQAIMGQMENRRRLKTFAACWHTLRVKTS